MFSIATKNGSKSVHSFSKSYIPNAAIFKSPVGVIPNVVVANMCDILMKLYWKIVCATFDLVLIFNEISSHLLLRVATLIHFRYIYIYSSVL